MATKSGKASKSKFSRPRGAGLKPVVQGLRSLVKSVVPRMVETVNPWGIPTFEYHGPMCYAMVGKNHVTFGFLRGTSLPDPYHLLEGTGKNFRHVKVRSPQDLKRKGLRQLIAAAARQNRKEPMEGMRPKRM